MAVESLKFEDMWSRIRSREESTAIRGVFSLAPLLRGEGWGEGLSRQASSRRVPLTRRASRVDLSPQAGRGEAETATSHCVFATRGGVACVMNSVASSMAGHHCV